MRDRLGGAIDRFEAQLPKGLAALLLELVWPATRQRPTDLAFDCRDDVGQRFTWKAMRASISVSGQPAELIA